jgi:hypothetical protein
MSFFYHLNDAKKLGLLFFISFISISFLAASCTFNKARITKQTFKKGKQIVRIIEKDIDGHYLSKKKLEHPYTFTEAKIFDNLTVLKYKRLALFSKEEDVFDKKFAKEISSLLVNAFKKASKNDFIEVDARSPKGRIVGDVFIFKRKLNWKFKIINGASYERRNSKDYLDGWKIVLQKGQKYYGEKELFGVRVAKNWIIYPVDKTWSNVTPFNKGDQKADTHKRLNDESDTNILETLPKEQSKKGVSLTQKEIEAKFIRLKKLVQKGLITKEEYKAKKQELLEKYF